MAKWDFLLLKFIKVDVLQVFSGTRSLSLTIKSRNFRQKNIAIKQKMPIFAVRSSRRGNSSDEISVWFGSSAG